MPIGPAADKRRVLVAGTHPNPPATKEHKTLGHARRSCQRRHIANAQGQVPGAVAQICAKLLTALCKIAHYT